MKKPELLAPAGDFERLQMAVEYGANAVYLGGKAFTMRQSPANFDDHELVRAVDYAHQRGVKVYLTVNTLPRCDEVRGLPAFLEQAAQTGVDAFIISDLGVMNLARRYTPNVEIHISTQAGIVNDAAAGAFYDLGAKRAILARELSLNEIRQIRDRTPSGLAIETFVHGAMCVSFSGRCLLSSYLAARDANRGDCAQPCRWNYTLMEEKRPGVSFPVFEDDKGTHILNARDLCMVEHLPELAAAGIDSFKIEGRAKSAYYVAVVTNAYRLALDHASQDGGALTAQLAEEVRKVSHRSYCTGFYYGPIQNGQVYRNDIYERRWDVAAVVEKWENGTSILSERNPFKEGEEAELLEPGKLGRPVTIGRLYGEKGERIAQADHPQMRVIMETDAPVKPFSLIRKLCK